MDQIRPSLSSLSEGQPLFLFIVSFGDVDVVNHRFVAPASDVYVCSVTQRKPFYKLFTRSLRTKQLNESLDIFRKRPINLMKWLFSIFNKHRLKKGQTVEAGNASF